MREFDVTDSLLYVKICTKNLLQIIECEKDLLLTCIKMIAVSCIMFLLTLVFHFVELSMPRVSIFGSIVNTVLSLPVSVFPSLPPPIILPVSTSGSYFWYNFVMHVHLLLISMFNCIIALFLIKLSYFLHV